ncbi:hypothetical protein QEN19_000497 [Hanseniaspora menglaensis]
MSCQFFTRTEEDIAVSTGYPDFETTTTQEIFGKIKYSDDNIPDLTSKPTVKAISDNGIFLALALPKVLKVFTGEANFNELIMEIPLENPLYSLKFSNTGKFLQTFQQFSINKEENENLKNCNVYDVLKNKKLYSYTNKSLDNWSLYFNKNDSFVLSISNDRKTLKCIKLNDDLSNFSFDVSKNIHTIFKFDNAIQEFEVSPNCSQAPVIATFTPVKSAKPASLQIWVSPSLPSKEAVSKAAISKTFFSVDSCVFYWNSKGTTVLGKTSTNFNSNSYNGENKLYLLSHISSKAILLTLSKDNGPIHDINWAADGNVFAVNSGYMPSKTIFYNTMGDTLKEMAADRKNTIMFSPNGRYVLIAGWGNLAGGVDIIDISRDYSKVVSFQASNINFAQWSPEGEFLIMAITSPRLRVDNIVKILHYSGKLVYVKEFAELLQCGWRIPEGQHKKKLEPTLEFKDAKQKIHHHTTVTKYEIDNAGKSTSEHSNAAKKPASSWRASRGKTSSGLFQPGAASKPTIGSTPTRGKKPVPGAAVVGSAKVAQKVSLKNTTPSQSNNEGLSPEQKKIRSLVKKYNSIQKIKDIQNAGGKLELTQLSKLEGEEFILKELKFLGWSEDSQ